MPEKKVHINNMWPEHGRISCSESYEMFMNIKKAC